MSRAEHLAKTELIPVKHSSVSECLTGLNISPRRNSSQLNIPRPRSLDRSLSRSTPVSWPRQGAQKSWWNSFLSAILAIRPSHGTPHSRISHYCLVFVHH